ncbi:MAG: malonyl-ACP O-methyltransferase BioC [Halofilum sp. (in: g-proteobacteria)]
MTEQQAEMLDTRAVRRAFERAAATYDDAADLQRETADELLDRLAAVKIEPERVIDLGCGTGHALSGLQKLYRGAEVIGVDFSHAMASRARSRGGARLRRRPLAICADMGCLPLADASVDVVFSSLALQWARDPVALFGEVRRVLRPDGAFMFSSFGPDTLTELRAAWAEIDDRVHVSRFPDMHDIGDAMLGAGLVDPVMDVDRQQRSYPDLSALMRSIKAIGARNAAHGRPRGLTGPGVLRRLEHAYAARTGDGRPLASWELVYGHAWGAPIPRPGSGTAREFHIPLESIGRARANRGD